jgi:hypothetical protein
MKLINLEIMPCEDTIEALEIALKMAREGKTTGAIMVLLERKRQMTLATTGMAVKDPVRALGCLTIMRREILNLIENGS